MGDPRGRLVDLGEAIRAAAEAAEPGRPAGYLVLHASDPADAAPGDLVQVAPLYADAPVPMSGPRLTLRFAGAPPA